jgi:hypothetical protein
MYYIFIEVHSIEYGVLWGLQLFIIHSYALTERFDKFFHWVNYWHNFNFLHFVLLLLLSSSSLLYLF